ncbi:MAG TPA: VanZ family protein [Longimicrobiales bacterium]|nr:VanZ family protein [Longimicrobiales bacterium]
MRNSVRAFAPALIWAAAVWMIGGMESTPDVPGGFGLDKVAHFTMYGVLGFLLARGWSAVGWRGAWLLPALIALLLGVADERRQSALPGRTADVADWVADLSGASTGVFIALRMARRRRNDDDDRHDE